MDARTISKHSRQGKAGLCEHPTVMLQGDFIWEEGSGADSKEFMPNLPKPLAKLPCGVIQHGTVWELDNASQNLTIKVSVSHKEH